jgi:lipopolysaccharide export system protein LptA
MSSRTRNSGRIFTIRRLRWLMLAGAVVLIGVLTGYIWIARHLHGFHFKPPPGLGYDPITDEFLYAPSNGGHKLYEVRASRQIRHKDGNLTLLHVGIELYGKTGEPTDHIHGDQFEYNPKEGVIQAAGPVFIDLLPPPPANGKPAKPDDGSRVIHLKTTGLVFRQKDEYASTDKGIEFMVAGMNGTAVGATYDSKSGVVVLQSQVRVSGLRGAPGKERPMLLTAAHAEMDRNGDVVILEAAKLTSATDSGTQASSAQHAVVHTKPDGTPTHVDANGNVTLTGEGRGTVTSDKLDMDLNDDGQVTAAHLMGVVRFTNDTPLKQEYGKANDAKIAFDNQGRPVHALMTGEVEADLTAGEGTRWLGADRLDMALAGGGKEPVLVRSAQATANGGAKMRMVDATQRKDAKGKVSGGILRTNVTADLLTARFTDDGKQSQLSGVDGAGRTIVARSLVDNSGGTAGQVQWHETGTGDTLKMDFRTVPGVGPAVNGKARPAKSELTRAEQRGSVKIVREALSKPDPSKKPAASGSVPAMDVQHADGDTATYDADTDGMTMTGLVKVSDPESALFADRVTFDQGTGDATAEGGVRVSYLQQGSTGEPVHVMSARAIGHRATGITQFFSGPNGNAKMWQAGSQVEAPVLDFDRSKRTVLAHGTAGTPGAVVKTVLVDTSEHKDKPPKPDAKKSQPNNAPVRVLSRTMLYTDATREVLFRGLVQVNDQDGIMRAQEATVYLTPKDAAAAKDAGAPISLGGKVDHMIATGAVEVEQPGRKATGERLVYTASDRTFVMTGTKAAPPKMVDQAQGEVTGAQLRFRTGDDSVEVLSGDGQQRVHTEMKMKQKDQQ